MSEDGYTRLSVSCVYRAGDLSVPTRATPLAHSGRVVTSTCVLLSISLGSEYATAALRFTLLSRVEALSRIRSCRSAAEQAENLSPGER
jgi:hypothetical protein